MFYRYKENRVVPDKQVTKSHDKKKKLHVTFSSVVLQQRLVGRGGTKPFPCFFTHKHAPFQ